MILWKGPGPCAQQTPVGRSISLRRCSLSKYIGYDEVRHCRTCTTIADTLNEKHLSEYLKLTDYDMLHTLTRMK